MLGCMRQIRGYKLGAAGTGIAKDPMYIRRSETCYNNGVLRLRLGPLRVGTNGHFAILDSLSSFGRDRQGRASVLPFLY